MDNIAVLPGDGIGDEVVAQGLKVLTRASARASRRSGIPPYGAEHFLKTGETMPEAAFDEIRKMDAILLGAIGDPRIEVGKLEFAIIGGMRQTSTST